MSLIEHIEDSGEIMTTEAVTRLCSSEYWCSRGSSLSKEKNSSYQWCILFIESSIVKAWTILVKEKNYSVLKKVTSRDNKG